MGVYDVQSQKELMGMVVDDADKKRRDAQDQVDDVNKKWQYAQETCNDYKGKLEQAESTNAAHVKVHTLLQLSLCTNHNMFLIAMWHAALWCSKTGWAGNPELSLLYTHLQCHNNIPYPTLCEDLRTNRSLYMLPCVYFDSRGSVTAL